MTPTGTVRIGIWLEIKNILPQVGAWRGSYSFPYAGFFRPLGSANSECEFFLKAFWRTAKNNPRFISRIKRRYALFKEKIAEDPSLIVPYPEVDLPENVIPFKSRKLG